MVCVICNHAAMNTSTGDNLCEYCLRIAFDLMLQNRLSDANTTVSQLVTMRQQLEAAAGNAVANGFTHP